MDILWFILDLLSISAVIVVAVLVFLLLFEPGLYYRVTAPVHDLSNPDKLRLLTGLVGGTVRSANEVHVFNGGREFYTAELEAIAAARHTVHLEAYIFRRGVVADRFIDALCERAGAGIDVRVIVDSIGSRGLHQRTLRRLRDAGVRFYQYHPIRWYNVRRLNNRTHRNLLIVDGHIAFIGGAGVADYWYDHAPHPWRDTVLRIDGPLARGLQTVFAENWLECTGELLVGDRSFPKPLYRFEACSAPGLPSNGIARVRGLALGSTPTSGRSNQARMLIQYLLAAARTRIVICSPYFIPDRGIRSELIAARQRGVSVEVITGGSHTDHHLVRRAGRKRFGPLLRAGVAIHEYERGMLHAKVMLVDDRWAVLGSTNFDHRSFSINDEVNVALMSAPLVSALLEDFAADRRASRPFTYDDWLARSMRERLLAWLGTALERHQ
jgi:cardiolipin synthase A/B